MSSPYEQVFTNIYMYISFFHVIFQYLSFMIKCDVIYLRILQVHHQEFIKLWSEKKRKHKEGALQIKQACGKGNPQVPH